MKRNICVRSMGLGAVIMLIGLAVGAIVSPPLGAQRNGVFDEIICTGLTVIDKNGNKAIALKTESMGNLVSLYTQNGEPAISLDANYTGNYVWVSDPVENKTAVSLASSQGGTNNVTIHSKKRIYYTDPQDGSVHELGDRAINLIASEGKNRIIVFDQKAGFRWEAP